MPQTWHVVCPLWPRLVDIITSLLMDDIVGTEHVISFNPHSTWGSNSFYNLHYIGEETGSESLGS